MSKGKTILIAGYYGFGNIGDEAILTAMLAGLRERRKDIEFIVVSDNPAETAVNHNVRSIHWKDIDALLDAAKESDLIILGGGGLFQDYWGVPQNTALTASHWGMSYYSAIGMLAVLYQKPFMLYSVGVGPLLSEEGRELTRWTFVVANVGSVRDVESKKILTELGIPEEKFSVLPDPAFTLEPDSSLVAEILRSHGLDMQTRPLLGVCIRNWGDAAQAEHWKSELAAALDQFLTTRDVQILFIPFQAQEHMLENDYAVALNIASIMQNKNRVHVLSEPCAPALTAGLLSRCQLVIGMRLHSLIFAASAGIPAVALIYDPKVENFMRSLGMSEYAIDLRSLTAKRLSGVLHQAWLQQTQIQEALGVRVQELKNIAQKTPGMAIMLLDQRLETPFSMDVLQSLAIQQTRALADKEQELQTRLSELEGTKHEVLWLKSQIDNILNDRYWKLAQGLRRIRVSLVPVGSRREQFIKGGIRNSKELLHAVTRNASLLRQSIHQQGFLQGFLEWIKLLILRSIYLSRSHRTAKEDLALIRSSGLFDETWYFTHNPELAQSKADPLAHYLHKGGREGRDPGPQFSSLWYLNRYDDVKKGGINPLLHYLKYGKAEGRVTSSVQEAFTSQVLKPYPDEENSDSHGIVRKVVDQLNAGSLKGFVVVTSAFVFDEFFNQRVINLSKFLSKQGWGVVYLAWRWSEKEAIPSIGREVYQNIFQIPVDMFLKNMDAFTKVQHAQKYFFVEFPYPGFFLSALKLRRIGFKIIYEIIDEWEEFHKVGQAVWFNKSLEDAFVVNANVVTAVSPPLIEKFSTLRLDIHLSPNGYTPAFLGDEHHNIARQKQMQPDEMHLGYFGHLTESWFDWNFLLKVLNLAQMRKFKLYIHLIGYGEPNLQKKLVRYSDRVKFYGKIHPSELHKYVKNWDAAMIWFRSGRLSEAVDPIKIYEYLYFGLPTIVKGISHLKDFPSTYVVTNERQALDTLMVLQQNGLKHLGENHERKLAAERMLIRSTWEQRFTDLLEIVQSEERLVL